MPHLQQKTKTNDRDGSEDLQEKAAHTEKTDNTVDYLS